MITLTKQQIRWLLRMAEKDRDNSEVLKDLPGQKYAALHALEYENMARLAETLEKVLTSDAKRITIQ
ncbi:MAG: hypothetical protein UGF45_09870 [Massilioclostridium sp.]|nr:hypothetical protein [Massilioclostridium sp.]